MYDIIGDIHGYAKTLEALLTKLGYTKENGIYTHPQRKVIFVGDFIDRGPLIRESLQIIKSMIDNGSALGVMGNHEYNAICFNTPSKNGNGWLREHSPKNIKQHSATIEAFKDYADEWQMYIEWFMSLPVFLDLDNLRIVHACWDRKIIDSLNEHLKGNSLNHSFLHQSAQRGTLEYYWVENILKGFELTLPNNNKYADKDGNIRSEIRVKWWKQLNCETYRSIMVKGDNTIPETIVPSELLAKVPVYPLDSPPVFIGHYWNNGKPELLAHNVCCVDYSVARGEKLVAYRWNGEQVLNTGNFIWQDNVDFLKN
jgi:hypothetical protein